MGQQDALQELNVQIGVAEQKGDREFLEQVLAPVLAFRRANGSYADRNTFLDEVTPSAERKTEIDSIDLLGSNRAVVTCVVSIRRGVEWRRFHNVRLFVHSRDRGWALLGWANEPL